MHRPTDRGVDAVVHVPFPAELARIEELRRRRVPRLLLVAADSPPPESSDPLEDWVRLPADPVELRLRAELLARRAEERAERGAVRIDADGVARRDGVRVVLTPAEHPLLATLLESAGAIVGHARLEEVAAGAGSTMRLTARLGRLRRTIEPLGLCLHAVRGRGYLLEVAE